MRWTNGGVNYTKRNKQPLMKEFLYGLKSVCGRVKLWPRVRRKQCGRRSQMETWCGHWPSLVTRMAEGKVRQKEVRLVHNYL